MPCKDTAGKRRRKKSFRWELADLPTVAVKRTRCPSCGSTDLQTIKSFRLRDEAEDYSERRTECRDCGERFLVVVE